ncbi:mannose-1-phosphate guanylyltransferase/mannose-6-phosphate isomerase [Pseudoroseicyclus aestuarii]|uniref:mannose-1-phosphate guanylyltransferase n=1 Tax=Pseudoroseicyclus aestuarii TaxID=1795041 RepID=A0A318SVW8_9RHOB|nr:mannose-1-phosphate guanylyltransferase/mannose-6-phosphate isomerase [Pseudoroseicyclus aestuarii]PYE84519.1 mannose-1-phosphate guanylyltransferase/mannose-1-phosphate guanylyltransferase/mannose-6-phosphate isomerase [Pseudoroseicyclus aestuarii]
MTQITPVILSGGSGTRLWPLSRKSYPKQFARLIGEESLFQSCARRLSGEGADGLRFTPPAIVTGADFRFIVTEQLQEVGVDPGPVVIEPEAKNTAPAVLAAALHAQAQDPEAVLLVAPSDHLIPDAAAFRAAVAQGMQAVTEGRLVTFGIRPDRPETGYGYLHLAQAPDGSGGPVPLEAFVEKPALAEAERMLADGAYRWNAGIFLFAAKDIVAAFDRHAPAIVAPVRAALEAAQHDLGFLRLAPGPWARLPDDSIDYAVMEKAEALSVVPFDGAWSDLGSWEAVLRETAPEAGGTATSGSALAIDCRNTLLRSEDPEVELVGIGLDGIFAVAMPDAVLVARLDRAQDVKQAVTALKARGARQAEAFAMDHRPWGHYETLALSDRFQVKRIVVKPGAALSLQSHHHRSEHWIVVAGTARVTVDGTVQLVTENQSIYVPLGSVHRMENPGKVPMVLIEVQTGSYLGEDDIIRYEDVYARGQGAKG